MNVSIFYLNHLHLVVKKCEMNCSFRSGQKFKADKRLASQTL